MWIVTSAGLVERTEGADTLVSRVRTRNSSTTVRSRSDRYLVVRSYERLDRPVPAGHALLAVRRVQCSSEGLAGIYPLFSVQRWFDDPQARGVRTFNRRLHANYIDHGNTLVQSPSTVQTATPIGSQISCACPLPVPRTRRAPRK